MHVTTPAWSGFTFYRLHKSRKRAWRFPKQTESVDIGHSFRGSRFKRPSLDSDSDGLSNVLEDTNGDGFTTSRLGHWNAANTDGDDMNDYWGVPHAGIHAWQAITDTNSLTGLRVYIRSNSPARSISPTKTNENIPFFTHPAVCYHPALSSFSSRLICPLANTSLSMSSAISKRATTQCGGYLAWPKCSAGEHPRTPISPGRLFMGHFTRRG